MNFGEGYRRLSIVAACLAGPIFFLYMLVKNNWRGPGSGEWPIVIAVVIGVSIGTFIALWAARKVVIWVKAGFNGSS